MSYSPDKRREYNREYMRKYRAENPEKIKAIQRANYAKTREKRTAYGRAYYALKGRSKALKTKYGIDEVEYQRRLDDQGGGCAICSTEAPGGPNGVFHVDHDHKTGAVRELLCNSCNWMLGTASDSVSKLRAAVDYLTRHGSAE